MIPKKIHYCWFGGKPLPHLAKKCIASWRKYCPDYEIIEWNESNFDINCCRYVKEAYEAKKWAFVTDYVRLYALHTYGGIYMDTDVEVIRSIDCLLDFSAVSGIEDAVKVPTGLIAAEANTPIIKELLDEYNNISFLKDDGSFDLTTNVTRITDTLIKYGLKLDNTYQTVKGFALFPNDYLCPKDWLTGEIRLTKNTLTIHHFSASWINKSSIYRGRIYRFIEKYCGTETAELVKKIFGKHSKGGK